MYAPIHAINRECVAYCDGVCCSYRKPPGHLQDAAQASQAHFFVRNGTKVRSQSLAHVGKPTLTYGNPSALT